MIYSKMLVFFLNNVQFKLEIKNTFFACDVHYKNIYIYF